MHDWGWYCIILYINIRLWALVELRYNLFYSLQQFQFFITIRCVHYTSMSMYAPHFCKVSPDFCFFGYALIQSGIPVSDIYHYTAFRASNMIVVPTMAWYTKCPKPHLIKPCTCNSNRLPSNDGVCIFLRWLLLISALN